MEEGIYLHSVSISITSNFNFHVYLHSVSTSIPITFNNKHRNGIEIGMEMIFGLSENEHWNGNGHKHKI